MNASVLDGGRQRNCQNLDISQAGFSKNNLKEQNQ
jgi:hypothetical protein